MRRRLAGLAVALLAFAVGPAVTATAQTSPAEPASSSAPAQTSPGVVHVAITDIGPPLTRDLSSVLRINATFVNDSVAPVARVRWRLRIAAPVTTRVGLTTPFDERGDSHVLWENQHQVIDSMAAGERHDVALYLPVAALKNFPPTDPALSLDADVPAIFPLRFEVTHRIETTLATADSFLIWYPRAQPTLRVGWLIAITAPPARDATGAIRGDALENSVSPGGRLDAVLQALERGESVAGATLPVTLAVNAETIESVVALAAGSTRIGADGSGTPVQRIGSPAAAAWLARLKVQATRHPVIAMPYADADLVAMVRAKLFADMTAAMQRGRRRDPAGLDQILGVATRTDIVWPVGEVADTATVDALADNGVSAVVLDRMVIRTRGTSDYTTTAASDLETSARRITAIIPDAPVSSLARDMAAGGVGLALARQRLLAETAVVQQQRPYESRDIFVAFPRDWQPDDIAAAGALLALPAQTPWLTGTTIPQAVERPARADDRAKIPRYPATARRAELPPEAVTEAQQLRSEVRSFRAIIAADTSPAPGTTDADQRKAQTAAVDIATQLSGAEDALSWAQSAQWRADRTSGDRLRASVDAVLHTLRGQVRVGGNTFRLTSTRGEVPVTIFNGLGTPVRVRLSLLSQSLGLTFGFIPDIVVPPARGPHLPGSTSVRVVAKAERIGKFPVTAQLLTPDGDALGPPSGITVNTTAYGRLALLVTGGAFALLVLASLTRFVFRRRRGRPGPAAETAGPDDDGESPAGSAALDNAQLSASAGG